MTTQHTRDTSTPAESRLREARAAKLVAARLYVCTDSRRERGDLEEFLHAAYAGGADIVQLRDKSIDADEEIAALRLLGRVAAEYGALFAVNDRADIAALVGADVFHVGQHDLSPAQARRLLGPDVLVGRSTHDLDQARAALEDPDVDYFCTGPVWATPTKPGRPATGLGFVRSVAELTDARLDAGPDVLPVPWFAIGGIDEPRLPEVLEAGARGVVVVRAVTEAPDPRLAAGQLRSLLPA